MVQFFDCLSTSSRLINTFEDYFYLDGISNKLGYRRIRVFPSSIGSRYIVEKSHSSLALPKILLTAIKICSFFTLAIPFIMLVGKVIGRKINSASCLIDKTETSATNNQFFNIKEVELIDKLYNKYHKKSAHKYIKKSFVSPSDFFLMKSDMSTSKISPIHPDSGKDDLVKTFPKDSNGVFITDKNGNEIDIGAKESTKYIAKMLKAAFRIGKSTAVLRLSNDHHCFLAAFDQSGRFKIIDSMSHNSFDLKSLEKTLNRAAITTRKGKIINFKGKVHTVGIQKGGHMCVRFATLFAHQILKDQDIDAYKKVLGAFSQKLLKKFSDRSLIDHAKPVESGKSVAFEDYISFMRSWGCYTCGEIEDWKDIPVRQLKKPELYLIKKGEVPLGNGYVSTSFNNRKFYVIGSNNKRIPLENFDIQKNINDKRIEDLIPDNTTYNHYIYSTLESEDFRIAKVPSNLVVRFSFTTARGEHVLP